MFKKESFSVFIWFLVAMTFVGAIGIPKGFNYTIALLFLSSIPFLIFAPKTYKSPLPLGDKLLIASFVCFGLSIILINLSHDFRLRGLDYPLRFVFAILVLFLLLKAKNYKSLIWYGVVAGALLAFGQALYEKLVEGVARANGDEHPIMFGDTSMMLGLLSFSAVLYFYSKKQFIWAGIAFFAGFCGLGGSILSGSRGGWVALPLLGLFLMWHGRKLLSIKRILQIFVGVVVALSIVVLVPQTGVKNRVELAISNITHYESGTDTDTSVGLRFDMWKSAWYMFEESPVFGVGLPRSFEAKKEYIQEGLVGKGVLRFDHAHNEYLTSLSLRGLVGLIFLLGVYLIPLRLFLRKIRQYENNWNIKAYAIAGAIVPMSYMDFALTQSMFNHNIGVMMFAFPIVFFWAAVRWAEREETSQNVG